MTKDIPLFKSKTTFLLKVYLVGSSAKDQTPDVYASKEDAVYAVHKYIFDNDDDCNWILKLDAKDQEILRAINKTSDKELAIQSYNRFASSKDQWTITECDVIQPKERK